LQVRRVCVGNAACHARYREMPFDAPSIDGADCKGWGTDKSCVI